MRRETRISYSFGPATQLPGPDGVTGSARRRAPARERRGALGSPQATEPGCGAEPHVNWSVLLLGARRGKVDVDQEGALLDLAVLGRRQEDPTVLDGLDRAFVQAVAEPLDHLQVDQDAVLVESGREPDGPGDVFLA